MECFDLHYKPFHGKFRDIVGSLYNIFGAMSRKKLRKWEKMIGGFLMEFSGKMV